MAEPVMAMQPAQQTPEEQYSVPDVKKQRKDRRTQARMDKAEHEAHLADPQQRELHKKAGELEVKKKQDKADLDKVLGGVGDFFGNFLGIEGLGSKSVSAGNSIGELVSGRGTSQTAWNLLNDVGGLGKGVYDVYKGDKNNSSPYTHGLSDGATMADNSRWPKWEAPELSHLEGESVTSMYKPRPYVGTRPYDDGNSDQQPANRVRPDADF